ncbi:sugar-binding domain-containing protein, partial [Bifidobacterium jacchi]
MTHTTEQAFTAPAQEPHAPVAPASAQAADPSINEIIAWTENPRTFAVNRLPAHSEHRFFDHEPLSGETSDLIQSLDGEWNVGLIDLADGESAREALGAFASAGAASCASPAAVAGAADAASASPASASPTPASAALAAVSFRRIPVPSNLQNEGVLPHQYVNQQYPWSGHETLNPPQIPHDHNHVALYRRVFAPSAKVAAAICAVAATTSDAASTADTAAQIRPRVTLTFHGAATAIAVWLNGRFVGYAEDSFTPSEFDVTDALRPGRNVLSVACWQYTTASWLEDQDFWRLHGIFRSVELAAQPVAHVENLRITPDFDASKGTGLLDVTASIRGIGDVAALAAAAVATAGTAAAAARGTESDDSSDFADSTDSAAAASSVLIEASLTDADGRTVWSARKDAADLLDQAASAAADAESAATTAPTAVATATTDA